MIKYNLNNNNYYYYFAYGSNIDNNRLYQRIGRFVENTDGILPKYNIIFNKKTSCNDYAYANIQSNNNKIVYGKIYKLTLHELNMLDKDEGIEENKIGYERKIFQVYDIKNKKYILAYSYIATNPIILTNILKPSEKYKKYFLNSNLPNHYIKSLPFE
jgi:gamma-glutamylcyclotransferase